MSGEVLKSPSDVKDLLLGRLTNTKLLYASHVSNECKAAESLVNRFFPDQFLASSYTSLYHLQTAHNRALHGVLISDFNRGN